MNKILLSTVILLTVFSSRVFAVCGTPSVSATNITVNSFVGNWSGVPTAVSFEYIRDQNPATPVVPGTPITNSSQPFTGLLPATTYYLHIRAYCGAANGFGAWVTIQITTLALPPCNPPSGLNAFGFTNTSANIIWTPVNGATSYQWVLNQSAATPFVQGTPTALAYHNATNLLPGTTYYFHLRTDCSGYVGDTSAWESIQFSTPPLPTCNAPASITASNVTSTGADVSWSSQNGILGWEFVLDQSQSTPISGTFSTSNSLTFTGLVSLTTYFLHLRTDCSTYVGDTSHWVTYSFVTYPDSCSKVTGLNLNFVTPYTAFASWNAAPGAYAYEYLVNTEKDAPVVGGTPTFSTYNEIQLISSASTYYLHVRSVCDTVLYTSNYTVWVTDSFWTLPGLAVSNIAGDDHFAVAAFPNPVQDLVEVSMHGLQKGNSKLMLMDMNGKLIKTIVVDGRDKVGIDMGELAQGLYLLRYTDNEQVYTLRLTKK